MTKTASVVLLVLSGVAEARQADLLAFSKDGARALLSSVDHDRREGGSRTSYMVIGGGPTLSVTPNDSMSHGNGPRQHLELAVCRAEMAKLAEALKGFAGVTVRLEICDKDRRGGLLVVAESAKPNGDFTRQGDLLTRGELSLTSDGTTVTLRKAGAVAATFGPLKIAPDALGAAVSPTGRLLLLYGTDDDEPFLAGIAESKTGRAKDLVLTPR